MPMRRASTNFQILEVLNFLPLKFGGSTENFRKFQFATRFYRNSSICILLCLCFFLDIFNRTFMSLLWLWLSWVSSLFCFNNFHLRVGCFASVLLVFFLHFFLFYYFFFLFVLVLNFQVCIKSFLVFLFFNRTKRGKCAFTPHKYTHLRLHLRKCSCFSRHDRLCRTCVLTGRHIQASQTGRTKHLGSVNGSSWLWQTKVFVSLSAAEADQKRPT